MEAAARATAATDVKVLVTGANGFLGRHVVASLRQAQHSVRALIRPSADAAPLGGTDEVEVVRADLAHPANLAPALEGVDGVVHLAAAMRGSEIDRFTETTTTTARLFDAMGQSKIHRLVLCSSFSVYDWSRAQGTVDESLPLRVDPDRGYAAAKLDQERMARDAAEANDWQLIILRPGFVWGSGNELPAGSLGRRIGRLHFVFAPSRQLPFTHVENCADCVRVALESDRAVGSTLNVVDGFELTPWSLLGEAIERGAISGFRIRIPYAPLRGLIGLIQLSTRLAPGLRSRLPAMFEPAEFAQRYRPLRYSTRNLENVLGWRPPHGLDDCLIRTFGLAV